MKNPSTRSRIHYLPKGQHIKLKTDSSWNSVKKDDAVTSSSTFISSSVSEQPDKRRARKGEATPTFYIKNFKKHYFDRPVRCLTTSSPQTTMIDNHIKTMYDGWGWGFEMHSYRPCHTSWALSLYPPERLWWCIFQTLMAHTSVFDTQEKCVGCIFHNLRTFYCIGESHLKKV